MDKLSVACTGAGHTGMSLLQYIIEWGSHLSLVLHSLTTLLARIERHVFLFIHGVLRVVHWSFLKALWTSGCCQTPGDSDSCCEYATVNGVWGPCSRSQQW